MSVNMSNSILRMVILASFCFSISHASTINSNRRRFELDERIASERRQANATARYPVQGIKGHGNTAIHPRLEIRELERNPDQFNVYLLGMQRFQSVDQNDRLSYFRVAGMFYAILT